MRIVLLALLVCACGPGAATRSGAGRFSPIDMGGCDRAAVIEDAENADHQVVLHSGRDGYMYSFVDDVGSTITPTAGKHGGTFGQSEGGANGSMYAAHITGKLAGEGSYAGFGINFVDPKGPYDATKFDGIAFFARRGADSPPSVRLKVPDGNTDPDGKVCSECFNDFGADVELDTQWRQFTYRFDELGQMAGWGAPRPGAIDRKHVYGVQIQVATAGAAFDVWVDDVVFYGCSK